MTSVLKHIGTQSQPTVWGVPQRKRCELELNFLLAFCFSVSTPWKFMKTNLEIFENCHIWKLLDVLPAYIHFPWGELSRLPFITKGIRLINESLFFTRDICCFYLFATWSYNLLSQDNHFHSDKLGSQLRGGGQFREKKENVIFRLRFLSFKTVTLVNKIC